MPWTRNRRGCLLHHLSGGRNPDFAVGSVPARRSVIVVAPKPKPHRPSMGRETCSGWGRPAIKEPEALNIGAVHTTFLRSPEWIEGLPMRPYPAGQVTTPNT